ncbi:MAG: GH92 family glycosyl hydrolase [Acidobacteriota bacterium]|nr:MAG: GH92 family glycosyl hydrolase [Acidobacteriota bacterium]
MHRFIWIQVMVFALLTISTFSAKEPVDYADPLIGTSNSRWMLGPYATVPFGMVQLGPDNQTAGWMSGYEYSIANVSGFSHLHAWTMGGLMIMPSTIDLSTIDGAADRPYRGAGAGYHSRIQKDTETASPGYYAVHLYDSDVLAEMTTTTRCGFLRFTFPESTDARILIDLAFPSEYRFRLRDSKITRVSEKQIEGFARSHTNSWDDYTLHFVIRFSKPFSSFNGWGTKGINRGVSEITGETDLGAFVTFSTQRDEQVLVQTGLSLVGIEGARRNLKAEMDPFNWEFDLARQSARNQWNELLGRIQVEGGTETDKTKFYTNLYRSYCSKQTWNDVDGRYVDPKEEIRQLPEGTSIYGGDAFWNTYWNLNGLWSLISPEIIRNWVTTQLELYDSTGWTSNGPTGIEMTGIMEVTHEVALLVAAYQKGIWRDDPEKLYEAVRHTMTEQGRRLEPYSGLVGNEFLDVYREKGYVPYDVERVSRTMDYAFSDYCVAQLAKALGKEADHAYFLKQSENWNNLFHPDLKYAVPRDSSGTWLESFNPFSGLHWIEGNSWQYSWYVPHDVNGLIELIGVDLFNQRLEEGFEKSVRHRFAAHAFDRAQSESVEYYINHGNEVNMQAAFLFNYSGKPRLTQRYARAILDSYYGSSPYHGWEGDEDEGQMGAWFVMTAMGMFEMDGGTSVNSMIDLTTPLFDKITIELDSRFYPGSEFVIEAKGVSEGKRYIKSASLNDIPLEGLRLPFRDVLRGGRLSLEMVD